MSFRGPRGADLSFFIWCISAHIPEEMSTSEAWLMCPRFFSYLPDVKPFSSCWRAGTTPEHPTNSPDISNKFNMLTGCEIISNSLCLRIPDSYDAKIAKICYLWTTLPVIRLKDNIFEIRQNIGQKGLFVRFWKDGLLTELLSGILKYFHLGHIFGIILAD